jgi:hypothetical protein
VQPETLQLSIEVLRREFKAILQQSFRDRADEFVDILDRSIQEVDRTKGYIPQQTFDALCVFLQKNLPPEAMQIFFCAKNAALGSHYHGWRQRLRRIRRTLGNGNTIATSDLRAVLAPKLRKQKNGKFLLAVFEKFLDNSGIGDVLYPENCVALQFALAIVFGPEVGTQFALSLPSVPGGQNRRFVKKMAQCAKALSLSQVTNAPPPTAQSESGDRPPGLWDDDDLDWVTI